MDQACIYVQRFITFQPPLFRLVLHNWKMQGLFWRLTMPNWLLMILDWSKFQDHFINSFMLLLFMKKKKITVKGAVATDSFTPTVAFSRWQNKPYFTGMRMNSCSGKVLRVTLMDCYESGMTWLWQYLTWSPRLKGWMKNWFSLRRTMRRWEQLNTVRETSVLGA